jgi:hypothetical protein
MNEKWELVILHNGIKDQAVLKHLATHLKQMLICDDPRRYQFRGYVKNLMKKPLSAFKPRKEDRSDYNYRIVFMLCADGTVIQQDSPIPENQSEYTMIVVSADNRNKVYNAMHVAMNNLKKGKYNAST